MDNQVLKRIEIQVEAQLKGAENEFKKFINSTKKKLSTITDSLNTESMSSGMNKVEQAARKVKVNIDGINSFSFDLNKVGDFQKKMKEAVETTEKFKKTLEKETDFKIMNKAEIDSYKSEMRKAADSWNQSKPSSNESVSATQQAPKVTFDTASVKEQIRMLGEQITTLYPKTQTVCDAIKSRFNDTESVFGQAKLKVQEFGAGFNYVKEKIQDSLDVKADNFKAKVYPVINEFTKIGNVAKNVGKIVKHSFSNVKNSLSPSISKAKELINKIKGVGKESEASKGKGKGLGSELSNSFGKGIKSIKNFALGLLSIRTAFTAISKAAQAYLSFDTQLNDSIQNSWNTLGSLLAPVLEYVANLFAKVTSYVAAFVKMLTGVDLVARANAKALDKQSKSAKKAANANKQLSSIDDINNLTSSSSTDTSRSDAPKISSPEVDTKGLEKLKNYFEQLKKIALDIFQPFKNAWSNYGQGFIDSAVNAFNGLKELGKTVFDSMFEVWTNGTGEEIVGNYILFFTDIFNIVGEVAKALKKAWDNAGNGTSIIQSICNIFKDIQKFALSISDSLKKWVMSDSFQEALNVVFGIIKDLFGYVEDVANWILKMYDKYLKPVIDEKILPAINDVVIAIGDIWKVAKPVVDQIVKNIKNILEPVIEGLSKTIGGITDTIRGIAKFVSGVFTGDWKKAWNGVKAVFKSVWNTLSSIIKTPINLILAGVENMCNSIINGFNALKRALNKIKIDIPSWVPIVGGKKWGFNFKESSEIKLPRLKSGHVAKEPVIAEIGEYANARNNPEIVSPISMMKDAFRSVLSEYDAFGGTRIDTLKIDVAGDNFYQGAIDYANRKIKRGVKVFEEM